MHWPVHLIRTVNEGYLFKYCFLTSKPPLWLSLNWNVFSLPFSLRLNSSLILSVWWVDYLTFLKHWNPWSSPCFQPLNHHCLPVSSNKPSATWNVQTLAAAHSLAVVQKISQKMTEVRLICKLRFVDYTMLLFCTSLSFLFLLLIPFLTVPR